MPEKRIGELLISNGLISPEQLAEAMALQETQPHQPLGQILCQLGYLSAEKLNHHLDFNRKRLKLGEILVRSKHINQGKLDNALALSAQKGITLGKALTKLNYIDEQVVAQAIASQYDLPYVSLDNYTLTPELAQFVNLKYAAKHRIVAIEMSRSSVTLAMAFPLSAHLRQELESGTKCRIVPVIASEGAILHAQQIIYGIKRDVPVATADSVQLNIGEELSTAELKSRYVLDHNVEYLVKRLVQVGVSAGASDIHLENTEKGMLVRFRIDGVLQNLNLGNDSREIASHGPQVISKIKILSELDITERRRPQDGSFRVKIAVDSKSRSIDFRVSTVPTKYGENMVIRILDKKGPMSLQNLNFSSDLIEELSHLLSKPTGIFLVTGPTGSGKSSSLYAILGEINRPGEKILTVEDPIEYSIDGISQSMVNEAIGNTFATYLRAFLRQDPDHIMVGEIRDLETASIAMRASLTGHTVLSTLHTNDATSAATRLFDMGIDPTMVSATLRCAIAQRLVRNICAHCRAPYVPATAVLQEFAAPASVTFLHGKGCAHCNFSGFSGRLPIVEMWAPSRDETLLINRRADNGTLREAVFLHGRRRTMLEDGLGRVRDGLTTLEELLRMVPYEQIEEFRKKNQLFPFNWGGHQEGERCLTAVREKGAASA
jgi:type II secretory ATPase GspE/PulE/Tfp pilus assembly ATPase PilB-like protein